MRSSSGGLLTTLLMFVPLIAVPALAIFGVPNSDGLKGSVDATSTNPPLDLDAEGALGAPGGGPVSSSSSDEAEGFLPTTRHAGEKTEDPFLEVSSHLKDAKPKGPGARGRATGEPAVRPHAGANTPTRLGAEAEDALEISPFEVAPETSAPRSSRQPASRGANGNRKTSDAGREPVRTAEASLGDTSSAIADWQTAVRKLKSLGITEYQLTPGEGDNGFLFTCQCASPDSPRITHRFEAESAEPFAAVQDVLTQVEKWKAGR